MACLFGLDERLNERELWLLKTAKLTPEPERTEDFIRIGRDFEAPLVDWCREILEHQAQGQLRIRKNHERRQGAVLVHLDAAILGTDMHIEAKSGDGSEWGETSLEDPSDAVPQYVTVQCHGQMYAAKTNVVYVPALLSVYRTLVLRLYRVKRDEEIIDMVSDRCNSWWERHVVGGVEPDSSKHPPPRRKFLNRLVRELKDFALVPDRLIQDYLDCCGYHTVTSHMKETAENTLIHCMGTKDGARALESIELPELTFFEQAGHTTYSKDPKYFDPCKECGVGSKTGRPFRTLRKRKRTGLGKGKK